jgi:hypothetical protein
MTGNTFTKPLSRELVGVDPLECYIYLKEFFLKSQNPCGSQSENASYGLQHHGERRLQRRKSYWRK